MSGHDLHEWAPRLDLTELLGRALKEAGLPVG
jgi:hypothetical protein